MSMLLGLLVALAGAATVMADDLVTSVDFYTDVLYSPPDAWATATNPTCGSIDHYTSTIGANASVVFEGNKIVVGGMRNAESGVLKVYMDDDEPFVVNLLAENVTCGIFFEYDVGNGTHNMTVQLLEAAPIEDDGVTITITNQPVLHLMDIAYWTPQDASATSSAAPDSSLSHHTDVGAIVGAVVSSVVGVILVGGALFYAIRRRRSRNNRHRFNPHVTMTSLSPRTDTTPTDVKFGSYARMDDDRDVKAAPLGSNTDRNGHLGVPPPAYSIALGGGLRARSRSPAPDRKPMP